VLANVLEFSVVKGLEERGNMHDTNKVKKYRVPSLSAEGAYNSTGPLGSRVSAARFDLCDEKSLWLTSCIAV